MTNSQGFEIDALQLYFGEPFIIHNDNCNDIVINQPTVYDIIKEGEHDVYSGVYTFAANPTMYRVMLWDMGVDWNKMDDFGLFCFLYKNLDLKSTKLLFGDLNFQLFKLCVRDEGTESQSFYLYNEPQDVEINSENFTLISSYIRTMFNVHPKVEKARGRSTKEWMIEEDRQNIELHKNDSYHSALLPLISSCLNHPGFKYKKNELKEVGIVEFMDSVQRLQIYESTTALLKGMYSGFVDTSKINKDEFNFMREISLKK